MPLPSRLFLTTATIVLGAAFGAAAASPRPAPNIVYILCDDLGYGDVNCLNPDGKIPTPNFDRLAAQGMIFTDAHSGSSVCTPTRYGIMTGRYSWRTRLQSGVLMGYSPPLIAEGRVTVASFLKQHGYHTAAVGKWHLGMDFARRGDAATKKPRAKPAAQTADGEDQTGWDYARPITRGPQAVGFDYYFGISASLDMPPYVFIENDRFTALPTTEKQWIRKGPAAADFEAIDVLPKLTAQAVEYVGQRAASGKPFFLYLPLNSPHTPIAPTDAWKGKSGISPYADFVMQTDAALGAVLAALDRHGLTENTLVIATSDNGCSPAAGIPELLAKGHNPSHVFRGHKADIFDGGHRIPFIVRWPAKVTPGTRSDQLLCLTDLLATVADILGVKLPPNAGEDSVSFLPALLAQADRPLRDGVVHHSINGSFSIRQGSWKLELCPGSGGWSAPRPGSKEEQGLPPVQLYDLSSDIGEKKNVQAEHPAVVAQLTGLLEKYVADGRSTPGPRQENDVAVKIHKEPKQAARAKRQRPDS